MFRSAHTNAQNNPHWECLKNALPKKVQKIEDMVLEEVNCSPPKKAKSFTSGDQGKIELLNIYILNAIVKLVE